ncbi:ferredoxin--NADP reductase [Sediminitomix flava]|uniref:Ring-1,2-phenylacetyl-CoA epoxidase subunit PaaE n=1 Tax=Sediminitomix flava TaxID=379075 RepID=A0A315ZZR0_SEDFL|nr:ferredoxin--NADP reductase [Sediminitomix flava]PWJ42867.1 ring-1,2-phenylacetyl-CoA epoxidase subunit PaaE [Sediminitomix flava]
MERITKLKIVDVIQETADAVSIHFKQPFFKKIKYTSGQFLTLLVEIDGKVERRCYSLNSAPKIDKTVSVTVKRVKDGKVSNHLFENVKKGMSMKVLYPMGSFTTEPNLKNKRHIVLFGAGSGITPLISILKTILHGEPQSIVSLFYGNRDVESIIFNKELNDYKSQFEGRLNLIHILESPGDFEECYKGRVERTQVPELLSQIPKWEAEKTEYFICGPSGMMNEAEEGLKSAGVESKQIHIERFSAPPAEAVAKKKQEAQDIQLILKNNTHKIHVKAGQNILDAALDAKLKVPYVCLDGICGSCKANCTSGEVKMRGGHVLSEADIEAGYVLPCISHPTSEEVVIEYA